MHKATTLIHNQLDQFISQPQDTDNFLNICEGVIKKLMHTSQKLRKELSCPITTMILLMVLTNILYNAKVNHCPSGVFVITGLDYWTPITNILYNAKVNRWCSNHGGSADWRPPLYSGKNLTYLLHTTRAHKKERLE